MFTSIIKEAEDVVKKCLKIKIKRSICILKKFTHSLKLIKVNEKLARVFQLLKVNAPILILDIMGLIRREHVGDEMIEGGKLSWKIVKQRTDSLVSNMEDLRLSIGSLSRREQAGNEAIEQRKLGWRVPKLPKDIVGFDEPLARLKAKVISDSDDSSVVVVSAAGGCGKTTLVKMLCNDPQIQEEFGENLFFVTVSKTPNFMVIIDDLLNPYSFYQQVDFQSSEDAKNKLENFLEERVSSPILLVLDDVWSESFINNFVFEIGRYEIVVTSRMVITKYYVFQFDPLSDEDAKTLFYHSAFLEYKEKIYFQY